MATKAENEWADSLNKAMSMKQFHSWDKVERDEAIKKAWANKPKTLNYLQAVKLANKRLKSAGGKGG